MNQRIVFYLVFMIMFTIDAQTINLRGKITNQSENPVQDAIVSLVYQELSDTTDSSGRYSIIKNDVKVLKSGKSQTENIIFNKGVLELCLTRKSPIKIEAFDLKGNLLEKKFFRNALPGIHRLTVTDICQSSKFLIIRAVAANMERTFRYFQVYNGKYTLARVEPVTGSNLVKRVAESMDSLKVTADGYRTNTVEINSYDAVVDIVLVADPEPQCEGCGNTNHPGSGRATIDVDGITREYMLKLPDNYDTDKAYKLIFCPHWLGGSIDDVINGMMCGGPYYGLEALAEGTAIFVVPQGLKDGQYTGFSNPDGRDVKFFQAMLDYFNSTLCIDQKRIFSTGFSFGGMMSFAAGCAMNDVIRAIAPMSGAFYSGCDSTSKGPVAVWQAHGINDQAVRLSDARKARDHFLARNGCSKQTVPVNPAPCVAYQGCEEGYPFIYCEFDGDHGVQKWAAPAVWEFFSKF